MPVSNSKSENNSKGKKGEDLAVDFLISKGFEILIRNFRFSRSEIDIICKKDNVLSFVEVKLRHSRKFGFPEEAVNSKKEKTIRIAAEEYIFTTDWQHDIRFDIISIEYLEGNYQITQFEDVFY
jgi:putative endonuclease